MKKLLTCAIALSLLSGCAALSVSRDKNGVFDLTSRREFTQGFYVSGNFETGDFTFDSCGSAITTGRGPVEEATADLVRGAGEVVLSRAGGKMPAEKVTDAEVRAAIRANPALCEGEG